MVWGWRGRKVCSGQWAVPSVPVPLVVGGFACSPSQSAWGGRACDASCSVPGGASRSQVLSPWPQALTGLRGGAKSPWAVLRSSVPLAGPSPGQSGLGGRGVCKVSSPSARGTVLALLEGWGRVEGDFTCFCPQALTGPGVGEAAGPPRARSTRLAGWIRPPGGPFAHPCPAP